MTSLQPVNKYFKIVNQDREAAQIKKIYVREKFLFRESDS